MNVKTNAARFLQAIKTLKRLSLPACLALPGLEMNINIIIEKRNEFPQQINKINICWLELSEMETKKLFVPFLPTSLAWY